MNFINKKIEECHKEYEKLYEIWNTALDNLCNKSNPFNRKKLQQKSDLAEEKFFAYCRNIYAKEIFEAYSQIKPNLISTWDKKIHKWNDIIAETFDKVDNLKRDVLVGLITNEGGYRLA